MRYGIRRSLALGAVLLLCLLAGCGKKEKALKPPEVYTIGGDSTLPLNKVMEDTEGTLLSVAEPSEEGAQRYIYRYGPINKPAALVGRYMEELTSQKEGFVFADDEQRTLSSRPELTDEQGSVILARASVDEGQIFEITVTWESGVCTVQVSKAEGKLLPPVEAARPFDLIDQLDYMYSLPPKRLGLEGDSMKAYRIYPVEGSVIVDGKTCRQFNVYLRHDPAQTNAIQGSYFLSADRSHIYRLDEATDTTVSLT
jgi:hypothetical protein